VRWGSASPSGAYRELYCLAQKGSGRSARGKTRRRRSGCGGDLKLVLAAQYMVSSLSAQEESDRRN
jgi:hypothetical protein